MPYAFSYFGVSSRWNMCHKNKETFIKCLCLLPFLFIKLIRIWCLFKGKPIKTCIYVVLSGSNQFLRGKRNIKVDKYLMPLLFNMLLQSGWEFKNSLYDHKQFRENKYFLKLLLWEHYTSPHGEEIIFYWNIKLHLYTPLSPGIAPPSRYPRQ